MHDHNGEETSCTIAAQAIGDLIIKLEPGAILTKFYLVAEMMDEKGEQGTFIQSSCGLPVVDILGLLTFATKIEEFRLQDEFMRRQG